MSIPLINEVNKNDINTSIIAIKKNIERINTLLGLNNTEEIDTSIFATKEELEQAETDLAPVDEVTSGNMHAATSNIVAKILSYSTTEHKTGKKSIDGKDVYSKSFVYSGATTAMTGISMGSIGSFEDVETINGSLKFSVGTVISLGYMNNDNNKVFEVSIDTSGNVSAISPYSDFNSKIKITVEYTKTTD